MTHKAQIEAINAELAKIGYRAVKISKPRSNLARIKAWKPETAAGRKCKSAMLYWSSLSPIEGVKSYQVRDANGTWHTEDSPGFAEAVLYQRKYWHDYT